MATAAIGKGVRPSGQRVTSPPRQRGRLDGLQVLRGAAASYVLLFHLAMASGFDAISPAIASVARWGFSGVDLFFVLSGFVIWHGTHDAVGPGTARRFLLRRLARIYLGYWPMLAVAVIMFAILAPQVLSDANLAGSFFLMEPHDRRLLISVSWSLTFELYFYGAFAMLLLVGRGWRLLIVVVVFLAVIATNLALLAWFPGELDGSATEGWFFLSPFVAEFCGGALVAASWHAAWFPRRRDWFAVAGVAALLLGVWTGVHDGALPTHQIQRLGSFGLAAAGLLMVGVTVEERIRWPRWSVALGNQSYALYLGHPLVMSLLTITGIFPLGTGAFSGWLIVGLVVASTVWITALYSRRVDYSAYRWACRRIDPSD